MLSLPGPLVSVSWLAAHRPDPDPRFALEVAGLGGARPYDGSWSDGPSDPSRPVASGWKP